MSPAFFAACLSTLFTITVTASPSHLLSRQTVLTDLPGAWSFAACFEDNPDIPGLGRGLEGASFVDATGMTVEACVNFCNDRSFTIAGLEFGQECYCDNVFEHSEESVGPNECTTPCVGNHAELCGAPDRLSVYRSNTPPIFPMLVPSVGPWVALGCYNDSTSSRALERRVNAGNTTVESCTAACQAEGFTFAGLEFAQECWCGSQLLSGTIFVGNDVGISGTPPVRQAGPDGTVCDMACVGNTTELCGGPDRLNLYNFTGPVATTVAAVGPWVSVGCYNDSTSARTLRTQVHPNGGVTAESCTAECFSMNFVWAGLEFGQECWCDTVLANGGGPTAAGACSMACAASSLELCGGPLALTLYQFEDVSSVVADFATLTSLTNNLTALVNSATTANVQTVGPQVQPGLFNIESFTVNTRVAAATISHNGVDQIIGANGLLIVAALDQWASSVQTLSTALIAQSSILGPNNSDAIISGINGVVQFTFFLTASVLLGEVITDQGAAVSAAMQTIDNSLQLALNAY